MCGNLNKQKKIKSYCIHHVDRSTSVKLGLALLIICRQGNNSGIY